MCLPLYDVYSCTERIHRGLQSCSTTTAVQTIRSDLYICAPVCLLSNGSIQVLVCTSWWLLLFRPLHRTHTRTNMSRVTRAARSLFPDCIIRHECTSTIHVTVFVRATTPCRCSITRCMRVLYARSTRLNWRLTLDILTRCLSKRLFARRTARLARPWRSASSASLSVSWFVVPTTCACTGIVCCMLHLRVSK